MRFIRTERTKVEDFQEPYRGAKGNCTQLNHHKNIIELTFGLAISQKYLQVNTNVLQMYPLMYTPTSVDVKNAYKDQIHLCMNTEWIYTNFCWCPNSSIKAWKQWIERCADTDDHQSTSKWLDKSLKAMNRAVRRHWRQQVDVQTAQYEPLKRSRRLVLKLTAR